MLATKLYGDMGEWPNEGRLSALNIRRACDASLRRLQTDYIDLYQMHHVDRRSGWDEIWEAMEVLRVQGKILYVGSSNFAGWHIATGPGGRGPARLHGSGQRAVDLQPHRARRRDARCCRRQRPTGWASSPGRRSRAACSAASCARSATAAAATPAAPRETIEERRPQLEAYEDLCAELGEDPGTVGLAWLLTRPAVTGPIVGPRTPEHLESALRAVEVTLDDKALARLDELFPGHKTAPEDYAW